VKRPPKKPARNSCDPISAKSPNRNEIQDAALAYIAEAPHKVSPGELQKFLSIRYRLDTPRARTIIKGLLAGGELSFTYEYGTSYLEISFQRPQRVTERIVILPPGVDLNDTRASAVVRIITGASFGSGRHPTTRLALRGIDAAATLSDCSFDQNGAVLLDIGTGSGILALAALQLGFDRAVGIDPDPCARAEAVQNAALNGLGSRFLITDQPLAKLPREEPFAMVTANLRYPTLVRLCAVIVSHLAPAGWLVLSGIKCDELAAVMAVYGEKGFVCRWRETEKGWVGLLLRPCSS
jgi:ribosomal protein L11 methyltransferase